MFPNLNSNEQVKKMKFKVSIVASCVSFPDL